MVMPAQLSPAMVLAWTLGFATTGHGQPDWVIVPEAASPNGHYGSAVAVHGGQVFVGNWEASMAAGSGVVAPYRYSTGEWDPVAAMQPASLVGFGKAVAIGDEFGFVGAWHSGLAESGAVVPYIPYTVWVQLVVITPEFPVPGQHFGAAVATDGTTLVVGAPGDSTSGTSAGAVFTFESNGLGWGEDAMLLAADAGAFDRLGTAVDIDGDWLIAGAPNADDPLPGSGRAIVFFRAPSGWIEHTSLAPDDLDDSDDFGAAVAIEAGWALIGCPGKNAGAGRVYAYQLVGDQWIERDPLDPWFPAPSAFGSALAIDDERIGIGAPHESESTPVEGAVYLAELDGLGAWAVTQRFAPPPELSAPFGALGSSVDLDRSLLIAGVPGVDPGGGAWIIDLDRARFLPGDVDGDGAVDLADALTILSSVMGVASVSCSRAADVGGSSDVSIYDAITILNWLFVSGSLSVPLECQWVDPTGLGPDCEETSCP